MDTAKAGDYAHIGKSVTIKGELSGSEDLYIDGQVEGSIELKGNNLTIGPNGKVRANVNAKSVTVQGKLDGNIRATEHTQLRSSAVTVGDIVSQRLSIEDGAYFKGKIDVQKDGVKSEPAAKAVASPAPVVHVATSGEAGSENKTPVTEPKRN
ncbi:MAG TPA: polymer-forming cytoskeletal protein [Terriglobales bacterium]|nr:polymer-forming cytoskeletal protein [Terriglobales bacterium]